MIATETTPRPGRPAVVLTASLGGIGAATAPSREPVYRDLAGTAADAPAWARDLVELVAGRGLLVLVAAALAATVIVAARGEWGRFLLAVAAGVGAVLAYGASELLKTAVTEERPCRTVAIETVLGCPSPGDWSWPSNHATIAAALATACVVVMPKLWPLVVPVAAAIALARVAGGVHYLHDVLAGAALGVGVTTLAAAVATHVRA
ncbi:phosphatase PAP2 family protein, partial [Jiangella endophytica]|uniref:phosphatase PAP2 family protein n=1 Tax=Jiangella endophytica TaxID=1623398 RepID=UPI000E342BCC